ncbi:MAG: class I SAM-dependent methyltransferase [Chloroflexi bacterium]|nr:MAG: class I SAM-dependent methyltransferase [Chloroflexota bacterium]
MENIMKTDSMTLDELQSEYDARADGYEQKLWFDQHILGVARLRKQIMSKAHGNILDVACGTGLNFPLLAPSSKITATDLSPRMLEIARQKAAQLNLNVDVKVMDAQNLDFADGSFDTVVSSLSTCTFPDAVQALREMGRVCRAGGQILLLEHGRSSWGWLANYQERHACGHYQANAGCRWHQEPLELVRAAGLQVLSSKRSRLGIFHSIVAVPDKK